MAPQERNALPVGSSGVLAAWDTAGDYAQPSRQASTLISSAASGQVRHQPPAFQKHSSTDIRPDPLIRPGGSVDAPAVQPGIAVGYNCRDTPGRALSLSSGE